MNASLFVSVDVLVSKDVLVPHLHDSLLQDACHFCANYVAHFIDPTWLLLLPTRLEATRHRLHRHYIHLSRPALTLLPM